MSGYDWKNHALRHLEQCYPNEGCGLVVDAEHGRQFVPCPNRAQTASEHFVIDPQDYAAAEDLGEVVCLVHSHPDYPARASEGDLVMCEGTELEWLIVRVDGKEVDGKPVETPTATQEVTIRPTGYRAPLVGRNFSFGILDCFTLIRDWYGWEAGIVIPDFPRRDGFWKEGQELYLEGFRKAGFSEVPAGAPLRRGDVILMSVQSDVVNHGGIYLGPTDGRILHHLYNRLSTRDVYGGYWLDRTRLVVRHPEVRDEA